MLSKRMLCLVTVICWQFKMYHTLIWYIYIYSGHRRVWSVSPYYPLWLYPVLHAHEDSCSEETMKLFFLSLARDGSWARSDIWHLRVWALTWVYQDHFQRVGVCHNVLQPQWYTAILTTSIWGEFMGFIVWKKQTTSLVLMLSDYSIQSWLDLYI